ncbi:MAG: putative glycoside hydrolase, partial [Senegalia sp. (in: firmicutes)]
MKNIRKKIMINGLILGLSISTLTFSFMPDRALADENKYNVNEDGYISQPSTNWGLYKQEEKVKGIFVTGHSYAHPTKFDELLDLANRTEVNSMVIDVKDDGGMLSYKSDVPLAIEANTNDVVIMNDRDFFAERMKKLIDNDIYPIARIVTFKDRVLGSARTDLAIKSNGGGVWRDNKGNTWLNPYNEESWEYPIQLAEEAALLGFKEIQFDYVRFPTDGNRGDINYGQAGEDKTKADAIKEFLAYARERLHDKGVKVSADVFGDIISVEGDSTIGQQLELLGANTDILSPMVYPSHYGLG